jgi:flagellar assembly protein FliH
MIMSDFLAGETAERVHAWTRPPSRRFTATALAAGAHFNAWTDEPAEAEDTTDGYEQGFIDGRTAASQELLDEQVAVERLARAIETTRPEEPSALAAMLAETVKRLVTQIVGEVAIDESTLAMRTQEVATLVAEDMATARIRLHPADLARLSGVTTDFELISDASLTPGTILAETQAGWIEDGPAIRLEKLRNALERMGAPR